MKNFKILVSGFFFFLLTYNTYSQDSTDFFVGNWEVFVSGTPEGDVTMDVIIERNDNILDGEIIMEEHPDMDIVSIEEEEEGAIKINYVANGYNVYFYWKKVDENNIEGTLMDMFETTGKRIIE